MEIKTINKEISFNFYDQIALDRLEKLGYEIIEYASFVSGKGGPWNPDYVLIKNKNIQFGSVLSYKNCKIIPYYKLKKGLIWKLKLVRHMQM